VEIHIISEIAGRSNADRLTRAWETMIAVISLAVAASAVIAWRFILPIPALFSLVQLASLAAAYAVAR
jgi:hypothetical protein